jgi:mono/diheme cytochrome c family protein
MLRSLAQVAACLCVATVAAAEDADSEYSVGREEYVVACAACHGENADGNGPIATMFKGRVPDLTGIAARNDGVFPLLNVIHIIDGRAEVKAHGNPMPIFGRRFTAEATDEAGAYGAEPLARGRVLELALYIQSIQK